MTKSTKLHQADKIRAFILNNIEKYHHDITTVTMDKFNVTRTTVHRHLNNLMKKHLIIKSGTTKDVRYFLANTFDRDFTYKISGKISEYDVFKNDFKNSIKLLPENIFDICYYGFTEIFNNALEHSQGTKIYVKMFRHDNNITITITDDGIGIFKNIYDYFKLSDLRESILELNKGKTTTEPANHTGEGIFFNSRAFDIFEIYANDLHYYRDNKENDWGLESISKLKFGTQIIMTISSQSKIDLTEVFKKYQEPDSLAFDRTEILVELARFEEEKLMSRSQAKRITRGLEKFTHVILDFKGIKLIGQGFVDEIFRVYQNQQPHLTIDYINANSDVEFMIERGLATAMR